MAKEIFLSNSPLSVLVDESDYHHLSGLSWHLHFGYAARCLKVNGRQKRIFMHSEIIGRAPGLECDHMNGNTLDNRRTNLRLTSHGQNCKNRRLNKNNTSGYKGVCWDTKSKKWRVQFQLPGKRKSYWFGDPIEAAKHYDLLAKEHFGEFARLNFPEES